MGLAPDQLGRMEPREFMNMLIGWNALETERRLWAAWVEAVNNPYLKQKPGTFKQFCDKMSGNQTVKLDKTKIKPEQFLEIIGAK